MRPIYSRFLALNNEKKQRILNAAFREFGRHGYKKTSAEQLAKSAGIAKGMLFYYFGSKLGLYEYLFEQAKCLMEKWWGGLNERLMPLDYIEQYRLITKIKLNAYIENPYVFEFLTMVYMRPESLQVSEKARSIYDGVMVLRGGLLSQIASSNNTGRFREDLDTDKAKQYVGWLIDGFANQLLTTLNGKPLADMDLDAYWDEFDKILDDCMTLFYKPE